MSLKMFKNMMYAFCLLTSVGLLWAQENVPAKTAGGGSDCRKEFKSICKDSKPGDGRIIECLKTNKAKFSDKCQKRIEHREKMHEKMQACRAEVTKLCGDSEKKADGQRRKCLEENKSKLSEECRAMGKMMMERKKQRGMRKDKKGK